MGPFIRRRRAPTDAIAGKQFRGQQVEVMQKAAADPTAADDGGWAPHAAETEEAGEAEAIMQKAAASTTGADDGGWAPGAAEAAEAAEAEAIMLRAAAGTTGADDGGWAPGAAEAAEAAEAEAMQRAAAGTTGADDGGWAPGAAEAVEAAEANQAAVPLVKRDGAIEASLLPVDEWASVSLRRIDAPLQLAALCTVLWLGWRVFTRRVRARQSPSTLSAARGLPRQGGEHVADHDRSAVINSSRQHCNTSTSVRLHAVRHGQQQALPQSRGVNAHDAAWQRSNRGAEHRARKLRVSDPYSDEEDGL